MYRLNIINRINLVLEKFFSDKSNPRCVKAKLMMKLFIEEGIFSHNCRGELSLRNLLRQLDDCDNLNLIPYVLVERKKKNRIWFFKDISCVHSESTSTVDIIVKKNSSKVNVKKRSDSDEYYVIDLCNKVLGITAKQQFTFEFLLGDSGRKLPVDAYYEELSLVIEYCEYQHTNSVLLFDNKMTVSGVSRKVQRQIYDQRRRDVLTKHGIHIIEFHYFDFGVTKKLKRNYRSDIEVVKTKLIEYI